MLLIRLLARRQHVSTECTLGRGNARSLLDEVEQREDADAPALVADTIPAPPESESAPDAASSAQLLQILQFDMHHKSDKD